jgi:broad specificity phosphatase PhoE
MKTTLYLLRHDVEENREDRDGKQRRQLELTRDFLAVRPIDQCYCSPGQEVVQTAALLSAPHGLQPRVLEGLGHLEAGESVAHFQGRVMKTLEQLFPQHPGQSLLVLAQHPVPRTYLGSLLGLVFDRGERIRIDPCGISVLIHREARTVVHTLNALFHLQGLGEREAASGR